MPRGKNIRQMFRSSLIVIIISSITGTIGMLVDGILTGQFLGTDALTAYGLVSPAFLILHAVGGVFSSGMQALCAKSLGAGRTREANGIFSLTTVLTLAVSLIFAIFMFACASPIAFFLGAQGEAASLHPMARNYLMGLSIGLPAILVHQCLQPIMQLDGDKNIVIIATLIMTVTDIVGDLMVVFVFKNGMLGMALMTSFSYILSLLVYVPHFFKKNTIFRIGFREIPWGKTGAVLSTGLPTAISRFCNTLRSLLLNHLLLTVAGSVAVTALTAQTNLNNFFASVSTGISFSTLLVVGILYGEEDRLGIKILMKTALKTGAIVVSLVSVVLFIAAPSLVGLYIAPQEEAFSMGVSCVRIFAFSMPLHALNNVFINYLQGTRNLIKSHVVCILNELVAIIGCALPLDFAFGANGVWLAFPIGKLLTLLVVFLLAWANSKAFPRNLDSFLFLPEVFDRSPAREIELTDCSEKALRDSSECILDFCRELGIQEEKAKAYAKGILDFARSIFEDKVNEEKSLVTDIRLHCAENGLRVRMRDGGKAVDRSEKGKELLPEGTRIKYISTMGTNYYYLNM